MKTSGFPCRLQGCDQVFTVMEQNSMDALRVASSARTAHEVSDHAYHHVILETPSYRSSYQRSAVTPGSKPRPPAR